MKRIPRLVSRDWIALALVLAGFILRLRQYLVNRSLWLDEAMLANNILPRSFAGLFLPLSDNQGAPVGFLLLQKVITLTFGVSEYALRLIPFLAGILSLVLIFILARKIRSPFVASLTLALFALSPALIYYTSEVKQYSSDVAITLGLCLLYLKFSQTEIRVRDAMFLAVVGMVVIWFSHPVLFVIGGLGLALFIPAVRIRDSRKILLLLLVAVGWGLSLGVLYFINLHQLATHQFFLDFWREGFMPHEFSAGWNWLIYCLFAPFADLLGIYIFYPALAILFLIGFMGLTRRLPRFGLFLLLVFCLLLLASFLTLYPFAGRMILFLAPALILLLAEGIETIAALFPRSRWLAWTVRLALAGALLYYPVIFTARNFESPNLHEHIRPTMETLREFRQNGDLVYVYYWAEPAVRFYAPQYGMSMSDFILGADHHDQPELYRADLDALRGNRRVWFLFSHVYQNGEFNERDYILSYLDSMGKQSREYRVPGTSVFLYLYDLR